VGEVIGILRTYVDGARTSREIDSRLNKNRSHWGLISLYSNGKFTQRELNCK